MDRTALRHALPHYLRGLLMGAFDVVPGVSGGTVALMVGIYERLIHAIRTAVEVPTALLKADLTGARRALGRVDWALLVPLGLGIVTALLTGARFIPPLLEAYPEQSRALFAGLILASLAVPLDLIGRWTPLRGLAFTGALVLAFVLTGLPPAEVTDPGYVVVLLAAMVAISAMILPGVSGSFLLLALGMYTPTLTALDERNLPYIAVFVLGCAIGLALMARLLEHLLEHRHDITMAVLLGLMVGALRALWPWQDDDRGLLLPPDAAGVVQALLLALAGFLVVSAFIWATRRRAEEPVDA